MTCPGSFFVSMPFDFGRRLGLCPAGELFIGGNFTAIALVLKKDLTIHTAFLNMQLQYGIADRSEDLFTNVHIRATLAVTYLQSMTNEYIAGIGLQK